MEGTALINLKSFMKTEPTALEAELDRLLLELKGTPPADKKYGEVADQLVKLYKLKEVDSKTRVSSDALVNAASSLLGILVIVNFEHAHVLTSKAVNFVGKKISS